MKRDLLDWTRIRFAPRRGDAEYLVTSDVRLLIGEIAASTSPRRILDFGADVSPYRPLFAGAEYVRVDITVETAPDIVIAPGERLPVPDASFDLVLSTQVLEHVMDPRQYLEEARRILEPGGRLLLSTHGFYEEHGFPNDYQRWTPTGLRRDLEAAGFEVESLRKLTVGPRAGAFLIERILETTFMPRSRLAGLTHYLLRHLHRALRPALNTIWDSWYRDYRLMNADVPYQPFYVGVAACGRVPFRRTS